jgi:hypothetical protein
MGHEVVFHPYLTFLLDVRRLLLTFANGTCFVFVQRVHCIPMQSQYPYTPTRDHDILQVRWGNKIINALENIASLSKVTNASVPRATDDDHSLLTRSFLSALLCSASLCFRPARRTRATWCSCIEVPFHPTTMPAIGILTRPRSTSPSCARSQQYTHLPCRLVGWLTVVDLGVELKSSLRTAGVLFISGVM